MPMITVVETPEFLRRAAAIGITEAERMAMVQLVPSINVV
jgi:hypothetical protein